MAKKHPTTQEELACLTQQAQKFYDSISPIFDALKDKTSFDAEFCGLVGELFDKTSRLSPVLKQMGLVKRLLDAEQKGLV